MTINISLPLDFFSIDFSAANQTKKHTRSTTNPKATKGYTCTQYTQHIYSYREQYIYIAIESWKSLGPQNLSTFNHSQRRQNPV